MSLGSALSSSSHHSIFDSPTTNNRYHRDPDEHLVSEVNWTKLPIKDPSQDPFFIKFKILSNDDSTNSPLLHNNLNGCNGFILYLTNMKSVWKKRYEKTEIEHDISKYCKGLNMSVSSIVQQLEQFLLEYSSRSVQEHHQPKIELIGASGHSESSGTEEYESLMESVQSVHMSAIRKQLNGVVLKIKALLPTAVNIPLPFYWEIHCERIEECAAMSENDNKYGEIDHSYILIQDFENSQNNDKKKRKRNENNDNEEDQQDSSARYFYENRESLFICNQIIRPLLGIVYTQSSQIDQLKSLCLKKEQELINYRQMYSSTSNSSQNSADILDVLDKILKPSKSNEICDISFGVTTLHQSLNQDSTAATNPLLRQLYSQFMKSLSLDNSSMASKKKKTQNSEPLSATTTTPLKTSGHSQHFDVGNDHGLLPEEELHSTSLGTREESQKHSQTMSQPSVISLSDVHDSHAPIPTTVDITHSIPTSQRSEYIETEEEKRRRQELEEKLNEKRKKKQANEQKNKIKKAFM
ncbi:hypothetical protein C9374_006551 [Naegleria lovaniensis]|uniref:Uncharacterized protein n=1 Tax=Naegleria lovaniensis TaxID=51637 RepID=A0AA88GHC9_NAELO|nr:uncharacterized protein C9374_006551 [Naegleria lovaniensis]KAG2379434.1 hypothetical protein C9374_006551 [Naegleria lovaniensis]